MMPLKELYQGFRQPDVVKALAEKIARRATELQQPLYIMEVCGGHTHTIMKYGLKQLLPDNLQFVHGPGCPVCIMPKERIDQAIALARLPNVVLVTLGDMIRVPGSKSTLAQCRAEGGNIEAIYDPMDVLKIARNNPDKQVVYFAIGFETTTPMTAVLVECAEQQQLDNLFFHINHVLVMPAMLFPKSFQLIFLSEIKIQKNLFFLKIVFAGLKLRKNLAKAQKNTMQLEGA